MKKSIFGCWTNSACSPICPAETEAAREKSASSKRTDGREHLVLPRRTTPRSKSRGCGAKASLRNWDKAARHGPFAGKGPIAKKRRAAGLCSLQAAPMRRTDFFRWERAAAAASRNRAGVGIPFFEKTKRRGGRAASRPRVFLPRGPFAARRFFPAIRPTPDPVFSSRFLRALPISPQPGRPCGAFLPRSGHCWVPSFPGASPRPCRPPRDRPRTGPLLSLIFSSRFPPSCTLLSAQPVRPAPPLSAPPRSGPATLIAAPRCLFQARAQA